MGDGDDPGADGQCFGAALTRAPNGSSVFRADPRVYLILTGIAGGLFGLGLYVFLRSDGDPSLYAPLGLVLGVYGVAILWLRAFEIRIENRQLVFQSLFRGRRASSFDLMETVELKLTSPLEAAP